ncbi:MAG: TetR/AcrR family transcriptional regulator [Armatimonadetes bacterium]|nr:TetR/AcrR family transcriptional regulator [Armatimonadota bacterium]
MSQTVEKEQGIDTRTRILRSAEKLFAERGYAATSVHDIAEAAGANKALLYYYFRDKRGLYESLIEDSHAEVRRMIDAALSAPGSYTDRLRGFIDRFVNLLWDRSDRLRIFHRCVTDGEQEKTGLLEKHEEDLDKLETFLAEAQTAGEFCAVDPAMAARSLIGLTCSFALWQIFHKKQFSRHQVIAHVTDILLHGLRVEPEARGACT